MFIFYLKITASKSFDGKISCNRENGVAVSATPPHSLVSALCNFSERVGSQRYIHVYFNAQVLFIVTLIHLYYIVQIVTDLRFVFTTVVTLSEMVRGHQIAQNANFYILLL